MRVSWCKASVWLCVLVLSTTLGIIFNHSASAITGHSQLAKDLNPDFKSQLYEEDPHHRKPVLILPIELTLSIVGLRISCTLISIEEILQYLIRIRMVCVSLEWCAEQKFISVMGGIWT